MMRFAGLITLVMVAGMSFGQKGPTVVMPAEDVIEGITFDTAKGVFVPIDELATELGVIADWDPKAKRYVVGKKILSNSDVRVLFDGSPIINILALEDDGFSIEWDEESRDYTVMSGTHFGVVTIPEQWVEVDLSSQRLRGYQGNRLVIYTKVSTGKKGYSTPVGEYNAGPEKSKYRVSSKYENAPMPFSVQLRGGYFIHGSSSVPRYPASHGCVRMPLTGMNAARYFFEWVSRSTPISVRYGWSAKVIELNASN
ncbi:MAG: L,D-transpeptidase family protein [Fimbriimonadaceae bacterium]